MKTRLIICFLAISLTGMAQTFTEKITKELSFEKKAPNNALMILNINGDIKIEGYAGDKILIEAERIIKGKTQARMDQGKQEIQLGMVDRADSLILYVQGACNDFGRVIDKNRGQKKWNGWGYNWNDCRGGKCDKLYDYEMNFVIKVPASIHVLASTINNGDVEITGVKGQVLAENINGSIRLKEISGATHASTINGSVDLDYSGNPSGDSRYYTLNGDINANFRKGLAAQLTFKSFNGEFYSSVDDITPMAVKVEQYNDGDGIHFKVNGNRYKVRQGGPLLDFETFNGNVYLKEKAN
ncbi:MAG TPA: hypothetical protein PLR06_00730 [Cyclobacteriaceae bacterium]|nr:hypothetical protein [Cyclobacteriaceae bacterium]